MIRVLSVFGTRPEAIKMGPVIRELQKHQNQIESFVCVTAQHRDMLDQVLNLFEITPDIDLDLMEKNQTLASFTARAIEALNVVFEKIQPDIMLVQGDTTTSMVAALGGYYQKIPVGHIEAGLRTRDRYRPFPEEINRRLIGSLATYHFAPTETAANALRVEGVSSSCIFITGNSVIDALLSTVSQSPPAAARKLFAELGLQCDGVPHGTRVNRKLVLVTAHRRENFGLPLENICYALKEIAMRNPDVVVVYPVHMNPNVQGPVRRILNNLESVRLTPPVSYESFAFLMKTAYLILTDSGGIQEEAPALGKPVLVLRSSSERHEAVRAGTVKVIGTEVEDIIRESQYLLSDKNEYRRMAQSINPYGHGHTAEHIVSILLSKVRQGSLRKAENHNKHLYFSA